MLRPALLARADGAAVPQVVVQRLPPQRWPRAALHFVKRVEDAFYVHAPRTWGPGPLADQQIAGVTMAAEEAIVFFGAFAAFFLRFLADEQAGGVFSPSASAPVSAVRPVDLRAAPGSARPRH